jgi:hypothetical protein
MKDSLSQVPAFLALLIAPLNGLSSMSVPITSASLEQLFANWRRRVPIPVAISKTTLPELSHEPAT